MAWTHPDDRERAEQEEAWIEEHGPIGLGLRIDEADLPHVVASWRVLEPPLRPGEVGAMPEVGHGQDALLAMEEALRNA